MVKIMFQILLKIWKLLPSLFVLIPGVSGFEVLKTYPCNSTGKKKGFIFYIILIISMGICQ